MHLLTPHIAIKHLEEQIKVYELKIDMCNALKTAWWFKQGIESMKKRIENYWLKQ